jgi:uncharacterized protein YndB with AHSA1/START domain
MGSIRKEVVVNAPVGEVWRALRDVANAADLFPGILTDSRLEDGDRRMVTFANGLVVTERILDVDDVHRRVAYSAVNDNFTHHSASMEVTDAGEDSTRFVWITDFLPHEATAFFEPFIEEGTRCFERRWAVDQVIS